MSVQEAKLVLEINGYCVENLWSIHDVKAVVECTNKEAMVIMYNALKNDNVVEATQFAIKDYAQINEFKLKDDSDI